MFNSDPTTIDLSVQDLKFDQPVVNIGGHADNDIVVAGEGVLAFHAMVVLQDDILQLISLAPEAEILLNGHLLEQVSVDLDENHRIEIGDYALFFQKHSPSEFMSLYPIPVSNQHPCHSILQSLRAKKLFS